MPGMPRKDKEHIFLWLIDFLSSITSHNKPALFQGLIVRSRLESLQHFKKPWAHEHEPVKGLLDAVKVRISDF